MRKNKNFKNRFQKYFFLFLLILSLPCFAEDPMVTQLSQGKLPTMEVPEIQTKMLPSGIKIYYLQDTELPVLEIKTYFDFGALHEVRDDRGFLSFFFDLLKGGGFQGMSPEQVDEKIEFYASGLSADVSGELSSFGMVSLQKNASQTLGIYFGLLKYPTFDETRMEVIRKAVLDGIKRRNEEPMPIALREFKQSLYGKESPHAWLFTEETIRSITKKKFNDFYKNHIALDRMTMAATSPLPFDEFLRLIEPHLKGLPKTASRPKRSGSIEKVWQKTTEFIPKPGNQTAIVLGHFGEKRFNEDKYKIILAIEILGGETFGSRLGDRIRTELGLVYNISCQFGFGTDYGAFQIATSTKSDTTMKTLEEIIKVLRTMVAEKNITEEELKFAKERILNRLIFEYENLFHVVEKEIQYDYYGYPPHYLVVFQKEIEKVSLEDVISILDKYFFPDQLKIMLVGDKDKIPDLKTEKDLREIPLDEE